MPTHPRHVAAREEGFTLIELLTVVAVIGILAAIAIPNFVSVQGHAKEASTKSNCHTLQLAAENFAVSNGGFYAGTTVEALPSTGESILDMLPGGQPFENAWTQNRTEPIDGVPATPGQIGYRPIAPGGVNIGYTIEGFGRLAIVLTLSNG